MVNELVSFSRLVNVEMWRTLAEKSVAVAEAQKYRFDWRKCDLFSIVGIADAQLRILNRFLVFILNNNKKKKNQIYAMK